MTPFDQSQYTAIGIACLRQLVADYRDYKINTAMLAPEFKQEDRFNVRKRNNKVQMFGDMLTELGFTVVYQAVINEFGNEVKTTPRIYINGEEVVYND